jgi:hypothetical protein
MAIELKKEDLLRRAAKALRHTTGFSTEILPSISSTVGRRLKIFTDNDVHEISINFKPTLNNASIGQLALEFREMNQPTLLAAEYVSPDQADKLKELGILFFDTYGNAFIKDEGLYIYVSRTQAVRAKASVKPPRLFYAAGLKLIFGFLSSAGLITKTYRDISVATGVSLGTVNWVMEDLVKYSYLINEKDKNRTLINKEELINRWIDAYPMNLRPKILLGRFHAVNHNWWERVDMEPLNACWGGEVGAARLINYLKPQVVTIYANNLLPQLQLENALRRDSKGEVEILRKFWNFPTKQTAPPLLIYADLITTAIDRNLEAAKIIYDKYIAGLIR